MFKIERNVIIKIDAVKEIEFGSRCTIGKDIMIRSSSYYGGEFSEGLRVIVILPLV